MPLGNVYYYFKTKDAIGHALVGHRANETQIRLAEWEKNPDPRARLDAFIRMTAENRELLARSGCPIGTLCAELHKDGGDVARNATGMFRETLGWIEAQFRAGGFKSDSSSLAVHLLSALQGASLLTHSFGDPRYIVGEAQRIRGWLQELPFQQHTDGATRRKRKTSTTRDRT